MTGHNKKMNPEMLSMVINTLDKLEKNRITLEARLEMDKKGDFPSELIRFMLGPEIALHLIFIPEEYGGLGACAEELAIISERMAKMDLAVATSFLAICLGMDPLRVGATPEQKKKYIGKIAEQGMIVAYGVTEPDAGSNVQALKTKAERVLDENGEIKGYRLNGQKQFITNGGVADIYTILAKAPDGPSFFVVEKGAEGLIPGKHEDKHGIRASDTCAFALEDLYVPKEDLIGLIEGQGLKQANQVFGYTRLMVATFALGGAMAAMERVLPYSRQRVQFGTTLSEKQGYTHRFIVPHAVELEASRAYIEDTARRLDSGEEDLEVEGSIAKYFVSEAADSMANDAIQALGGYGYIREYEVEKIKRDVRILTIYEGTSEIQRSIISMFRMKKTVKSKGSFYRDMADSLSSLPEETAGPMLARAVYLANDIILAARRNKLTKFQHVMFVLADIMTWIEVGDALCRKAATYKGEQKPSVDFMMAAARLFARDALNKVYTSGMKILKGCGKDINDIAEKMDRLNLADSMTGYMKDMDLVADEMVKNF